MPTTTDITYERVGDLTWGTNLNKWSDSSVRDRNWKELGIYKIDVQIDEALSVTDLVSNSISCKFLSTFEVAESDFDGVTGRHFFESLSLCERLEGFEVQQFHFEDIGIAELGSNEAQRSFHSKFGIKHAHFQKEPRKNILVLLNITEAQSKSIDFKLRQRLRLRELPSNQPILGFASSFALSSYCGKGHAVNSNEELKISDKVSRAGIFFRTVLEELSVSDTVANQAGVAVIEELKLLDAFLRKADVALADMVLTRLSAGQDVDLEAFENLITNGAMPGHSTWRDFIPGDYKYSKALFRVIIESQTEDRAQIQKLDVAVDVPDLFDRGTATISDAESGARIEFSKNFHIIPDVTLTAKGGTSNPTAPEFLEQPNLLGFVVRMRDTITGEYVKGTCTWTASGY